MNWIRGFKRIIHVLTIVIAVACGVVAGFLPIQQYDDAHIVSESDLLYEYGSVEETLKERTFLRQPYDIKSEKFQKDWADYIDQLMKDKEEQRNNEVSEKQRKIKEVLDNRRKKSFWYSLSMAELTGMVILYGLGGAIFGYVGTWVVLWYGGLAIFIFIAWLILGFANENPKDEQKE